MEDIAASGSDRLEDMRSYAVTQGSISTTMQARRPYIIPTDILDKT